MATTSAIPVGPALDAEVEPATDDTRPTTSLDRLQLLQVSIFWFALNAIWGGFEIFQQKRVVQLIGDAAPLALGAMEFIAMPIAVLTMPVMGSISDYASSRWGRRRPFILFGSLTTAVALVGLGLSPTFPVLVLFFVLLQLTSNAARGPFAGLVPDLVPERQVGIASGLMGLMITLGLVGGYLLMMSGYLLGEDFALPMLALGGFVAIAGIGSFLWIPKGPPGKPRGERSWTKIALETFGTDILRQRSYVFLLGSRFFILMAIGFFMNLNILYLQRTFGLEGTEQGTWVLIGLGLSVGSTGLGTIPGARISDRVGRKPVIYGASLVGAVGMTVIGLAPTVEVAVVGIALVGLAGGAFLAVDWALMTDIIPKASAGRYMGLSNVVEATNGPIATTIGGALMYAVGLGLGQAVGARAAMLAAVVMFALGALLLTQVREPRRTRAARGAPPAREPSPTLA
ncbi:MAG TPA: MFS transporter [Candidatus Limnocylindrales bacterium]